MYYILYNPLSNKGSTLKDAKKIAKYLNKKKISSIIMDILKVDDINMFLSTLLIKDAIVIVGGDGTIHRICNKISQIEIPNDIYVSKTGTGNDFYRSLTKNKKIVKINEYLYKLPTVKIAEHNIEEKYVNGCGIGLDGYTCDMVNNSTKKYTKLNYLKNTMKAVAKYKKIKYVNLEIDGVNYEYKNVWFCSVMNSMYQGGGMKFAPKAKRLESKLYAVIIHSYTKLGVILRTPLIYLGWQGILKHCKIIEVNDYAKITIAVDAYSQIDGDTNHPVSCLEVSTYKE